jgi:hypothetical protein
MERYELRIEFARKYKRVSASKEIENQTLIALPASSRRNKEEKWVTMRLEISRDCCQKNEAAI